MRIKEKLFRGVVRLYTQTALAKHLGITQTAVSRKMKYLQRLRIEEFTKLCKILEVNPQEFIEFE